MEKELKIIIALIILLVGVIFSMLFFTTNEEMNVHIITEDEWDDIKLNSDFVDSSNWYTYVSEEYAYEMKYPLGWEFNLIDGTMFHPEACARNKYDKCIARITVGVYPDTEEVKLEKKCNNISKSDLRYISGDVWMCEEVMSEEFALTQGYNRKKEYYFKDGRGSVFEVNLMYMQGENLRIENEMIQTIKLKAK
ncbi:MAG: hypothetical protein CR972_04145 [Candidatus Moraniibacteriota bacterium]|nr:MAG: hypothetical protein CR972_04145 [Candidatus Moranbacteria bacterium]